MAYEHLFKPIKLGRVEVKNRVALAPMGVGLYTPDETYHYRTFRYLEERVKGEVGLVLSNFVFATTLGGYPMVGIYDDRFIPSHKKYTEICHKYGAKVFLQIASFGGKGGNEAPSAIDSPLYLMKRPRELTNDEVKQVISDFIQAGRRAQDAGYDGVELHGSHGYLMEQFMSPHANKRTDEFGGDFERRMRVPVEIVRGIHKLLGDDFPVGFKFSGWEEITEGIDFDLAQKIALRMTQENLVYIHVASTCSTIFVLTDYPSVPVTYTPRNTLVPLAENIKKVVKNIPIIATGAIVHPKEADDILAQGKADMVAIGRGLLADAHWVKKAKEGKRYCPCIRCNWCHTELFGGRPLSCSVNPYLLKEAQEPLNPATRPQKVMVAGGGPGGIMAALVASRRGHKVTLYEKQKELGGMIVPGSKPKFKPDVKDLLNYLQEEIKDSTVTVKTGLAVTSELVDKESPDCLVIAIGGTFSVPPIPGADKKHVVTAVDALRNIEKVPGKNVVVIGGGDVGCETAAYLAQSGKKVTLVEILNELMADEITNAKIPLVKIMEDLQIDVLLGTKVDYIRDDEVIVMGKHGIREIPADNVVLALGVKAAKSEVMALEAKCSNVFVIGDCITPGRIRDAIREGDHVGRLI